MDNEDVIVAGLKGNNQAIAFYDEVLDSLREEIKNRPKDSEPLTSVVYRTWDRRCMQKFGACWGTLKTLTAFRLITVVQQEKLRIRAQAVLLQAATKVDMGT